MRIIRLLVFLALTGGAQTAVKTVYLEEFGSVD